jgi:SAM-dependent methyltransferase
MRAPQPHDFETVACYLCDSARYQPFLTAEDDLTGKPGRFEFVVCQDCGLAYQHPRLTVERVKDYYDDEYIAHRKKTDWGWLTPLYERAMDRHDRAKADIVQRYCALGPTSKVLDVGCGAGTFLLKLRKLYGALLSAVDFKDLAALPGFEHIDFRCGLLYEQKFDEQRFDLITMWHFLEHDYDPVRSLAVAREQLAPGGHLITEVPRLDSMSFRLYQERWPGLQAPQHTALYSKKTLLAMFEKSGFEIVDYLPYGAFPAYFYLFAGLAFKLLKGRGLNLDRAIFPYFVGQALLTPLLAFERRLNLAMQTVIARPHARR